MSSLRGKSAVVAGASKGIGAGIAKALASAGASVIVNYSSSKQGAEAVVATIVTNGGNAVAVRADVSRPLEAKALVDAAIEHYGRLDIVVNNSGTYKFAPLDRSRRLTFTRASTSTSLARSSSPRPRSSS